jgi:hypothetical protein
MKERVGRGRRDDGQVPAALEVNVARLSRRHVGLVAERRRLADRDQPGDGQLAHVIVG